MDDDTHAQFGITKDTISKLLRNTNKLRKFEYFAPSRTIIFVQIKSYESNEMTNRKNTMFCAYLCTRNTAMHVL